MWHAQALFALLLLGCERPTGSFVLPPSQSFFRGNRRASAEHEPALSAELECRNLRHRHVFTGSAAYHRSTQTAGVPHRSQVVRPGKAPRLRGQGEPAAETTAVSATQNPQSGEAASLSSDDGVACLLNRKTGSRVILVGVVHGKEESVELAEKIVREVKPDVVMLELDADRLEDLPPGKAHKTQDGLTWFTPDEIKDEAPPPPIPEARKRRRPFSFVLAPAANLVAIAWGALGSVFDEEEGMSEMGSAVREAQACGARVCLGDRDFEETKRRLVEAGLADSVDDESLDDPEALLHSSMSMSGMRKFASFNLEKPETRETARRYYAALDTVCDRRALSAMIPERDEVMAKNLMALGGGQTTVALLGVFHVDGIERILMSNGWQTQEAS